MDRPDLSKSLDDVIASKRQPAKERKERQEKQDAKPQHHKEKSGGPVKHRGDRDERREDARPVGRGGGRGGGHRGGDRGGDRDREWKHDKAPRGGAGGPGAPFVNPAAAMGFYPSAGPAGFFPPQAGMGGGSNRPAITLGAKIIVDGLDREISAEDLTEIFGQVGELKSVSLLFGNDNRPDGRAEIVYRHRAGAESAVHEFDGREVDGEHGRIRIRVRLVDGGSSGGGGGGAAAPAMIPPMPAGFGMGMGMGMPGFGFNPFGAAAAAAPNFAQVAAATAANKNPFVFVKSAGGGASGGRGGASGGRGGGRGGFGGGNRRAAEEEEDEAEEEEEEEEEEQEHQGGGGGQRRGGFRGGRGRGGFGGGRGRGGRGAFGGGRGGGRGGFGGGAGGKPASEGDLDSALDAYFSAAKKE